MALGPQVLATGFTDLSNNRPATVSDAARRWANAYATYARSAMALDAVPVKLNDEALQTLFLASMTAQTFLTDLPTNLTAYWMTPPVAFVSPLNTGAVVAAAGFPVLTAGIATFMAFNKASQDPQLKTLDQLAGLCHAFTATVTATMTNLQTGVTVPALIM